jgi:sortase A
VKLAPPRPDRADAAPEETADGLPPLEPWPGRPGRRLLSARSRRLALLLKSIAIVLAVAGVLALTDGVLTLVWQEPISSLLAHFDQTRLAQSLKRLETARATPAEERALAGLPTDNQRIAFFARRLQQSARAGQAVGRIRIPRIGADFVVVAGTDEASLQKGPGIYAGTSVPGLRGTVGIAGHRTTYLAPFRRINELAPGDRVTLEMPYGFFTYTVLSHRIVSPEDVSVLQPAAYDQVVLTACNPLYSAAQRIVVFARLTAAAPAGPALAVLHPAPAPAVLGAADAEQTVLGGAVTLAPPLAPVIGAGQVLLGSAALAPPARAPVAVRARPARAPAATAAPPTLPAPTYQAPVAPAPRTVSPPAPAPAPRPTPAPPAVKAPRVAPPATPTPTTPVVPQARVQGTPGGPAPVIGVPGGG